MDLVDKRTRKFFNFKIDSKGVSSNGKNICKITETDYSTNEDSKIYNKYPRYILNGKKVAVDEFRLKKASNRLCKAYESYAKEFKKDIIADLRREAGHIESKEKKKLFDIDAVIDKIMENKEYYFKKYKGRTWANKGLIERDFNIGSTRSRRVKTIVEEKYREEMRQKDKDIDIFDV